jgi:SpoVK/Ycf46/Vps4 family AAA+-type ATPase
MEAELTESDSSGSVNSGQPTQYALYGPGYAPTTPTAKTLPAGCYDICVDQKTVYAVPALKPSGLLLELPEMRSEDVIQMVEKFWDSEKDYKEGNEFVIGGAAFRVGIMIYGSPGTGKSCTIKIVANKLIERGGIVFHASINPDYVTSFLTDFSKIEEDRKSIVILEDIDSLIETWGESAYLEMLDSAKSINNALFIATTNYPERLDPRIYNRPGRFSHIIKIGLPGNAAREAYLKAILKNHRDVSEIVEKTNGFTIDHLTALVNAVYREKKNLRHEIERLRTLFKVPKADNSRPIGINDNLRNK